MLLPLSCAMWGGGVQPNCIQGSPLHGAMARGPSPAWGSAAEERPDGIRQLVAGVRRFAFDADRDEVLLLPNDPNVEAWFVPPDPNLRRQFVFSDQYWDRYLDRDFALLSKTPPKVIVIGPRNFWRAFQQNWNMHRGCERLVDLVRDKLLPDRYLLQSARQINFLGHDDFMDVYVRNDGRPLVTAVGSSPSVQAHE